jgi:hypothetical protein
MRRLGAVIAVAAALAGSPAVGGEAQERLFETGLLDGIATGGRLVYHRERSGSFDATRVPAVGEEEVEVTLVAGEDGRREAHVALTDSRGLPAVAELAAGAGHPILLVFMETNVHTMATLTGGSPFYIRNRMREALGEQDATEAVHLPVDGERVPGTRLRFRPFADDPNRAKMGAFADLEITVVVSEAVPGGFAELSAVTGPGADGAPVLAETFTYERIEEGS